eukprot:scaffold1481_cov23-Cyclotella_meneghiniana.AAC.3
MKDWMYSFATDIETKSEEEYSLQKLVSYLYDDKIASTVSDKLMSATRSFVNETLKKNLPILSLRQYIDTVSGWVKDNSFSESENAALKGDKSGPKANNVLHISTDATVQHTNQRYLKMQTNDHQNAITTKVASGRVTQLRQNLSLTVNDFIADDLESQWNALSDSDDNNRVFYVRRKQKKQTPIDKQSPIPDLDRTRTVTISCKVINNTDCTCLHCDCFYFMRHKLLCRHVYAVINTKPSHHHIFPECLKAYPLYMHRNTDFTKQCDDLTEMFISNKCLVLTENIDKVCSHVSPTSEKPVHWFLEPKQNIIDVSKRYGNVESDDSDEDNIPISALKRVEKPMVNKQDAYNHYMKDYKELCNTIKNNDDDVKRIMREGFMDMRKRILELRVSPGVASTSEGLNSFPSNTTVPKLKRKCPGGSPSRRV